MSQGLRRLFFHRDSIVFGQLLFLVILLGSMCCTWAKTPGIRFEGGDGTSPEKAIVIKGATEETGVRAEYEYLREHYPGAKLGGQSLQNWKGKSIDILKFKTAEGKDAVLFFDISEFFGK